MKHRSGFPFFIKFLTYEIIRNYKTYGGGALLDWVTLYGYILLMHASAGDVSIKSVPFFCFIEFIVILKLDNI